MPPPTLTPDEWLVLQSVPLWMRITNRPDRKGNFNSNHILSIAMQLLAEAEKNAKENIVFELVFSMRTDSENVAKKFHSDKRLPEVVLRGVFSILNTKLSAKEADEIRKIYEWDKSQIGDDSISKLIALADKMAAPRASSTTPPSTTKPISKSLSVYLLVDSSRRISDDARFFNTGITTRFCDPLRARPKSSVPFTISFIPINETSDLVVPVESSAFHAPSLVGTGSCHFGRALLRLHVSLASQPSDATSLALIFLAGAPEDAWQKPAKHLQDLAASGKMKVIAVGSGAISDLACLKGVGALNPLIMSDITQGNTEQLFKWFHGVIEIVMGELESGTPAKQIFPPLPACLKTI